MPQFERHPLPKKQVTPLAPVVVSEYNAALMAHLAAHQIQDNRDTYGYQSRGRGRTEYRGHDLTQEFPRLAGNAVVWCAFQETPAAAAQPVEAAAEPAVSELAS